MNEKDEMLAGCGWRKTAGYTAWEPIRLNHPEWRAVSRQFWENEHTGEKRLVVVRLE